MLNDNEKMFNNKQEIDEYKLEKVTGGISIEDLIRKMNEKFGIKSDISDSYNSNNKDGDIDVSP